MSVWHRALLITWQRIYLKFDTQLLCFSISPHLHSDLPGLGRRDLDVGDVEGLLRLPGHGGLAGDGLAIGGPQGLKERCGHLSDGGPRQ